MPEDSVKVCKQCQQSFPATLKYFFAERRGKYGLRSLCKACFTAKGTARRRKLKEDSEQYAEYRARQKPKELARRLKPKTDEQLAAHRKYQREWQQRKRDRIWAGSEDEILAYLKRIRGYGRSRYYRIEPSKRNLSSLIWRQKVRANGGTLTAEEVKAKHVKQRGRCFWCGINFGSKPHLDHIIPVSKGGLNNDENTVLSCPTCNHRKSNLDLETWLARLHPKSK